MTRKKYDIEMQNIMTLSQKLVGKQEYGYLKDYACNVLADKIALLDIYIIAFEDDEEMLEWLKALREQVLRLGEALWVRDEGDQLTNLGLKVGRTGRRRISAKNKRKKK